MGHDEDSAGGGNGLIERQMEMQPQVFRRYPENKYITQAVFSR